MESGEAGTHTAVAFFWLVAKLQHNNAFPNSTISK